MSNNNPFEIIAPIVPLCKMIENPMPIYVNSQLKLKKAVYRIAVQFRREFEYDFVQYGYKGLETDINHRAFLWYTSRYGCFGSSDGVPCIGATCFRWREYTDHEPGWAMQWIWLHPYFRGKGILTRAWPMFEKEFGNFYCEPPRSRTMESFLLKMKYKGDE